MVKHVLLAALAAGILCASAGATSGKHPAALLAKEGDAICKLENKRRAANPNPPTFAAPTRATVAQIKASAGYLGRDLAITKNELTRVFGLGTPTEAAKAAAWTKLHTLLTTVEIPTFTAAVAAARNGDKQAFIAAFAKLSTYDAEQTKLQNTIGFKVCGK